MSELKPGWRRVKFGEVVRQVKDKADPETSGLERFVAGEHMATDDLSIRRWGEIGDGYLGPAFNMRFRPGQVLYGSRRTYLRKVAVADFEGICANTTFVLESADPAVLLPELLPFIMSTEAFHEHSKRESKGSVNPYVNFSDIAWYEFALPPLEEQRRIQGMLSHWARAVDAHRNSLDAATALSNAVVVGALWPGTRADWIGGELEKAAPPPGWTIVRAEALSTAPVTKGATPSGELAGTASSGRPFLKVYNLTFDGSLDFSVDPTWISPAGHRELRRSTTLPGDVLMNIVGPPMGKVSTVPAGFPESNINQAIVRYRPLTPQVGEWLEAYLLSPIAQNWLLRRSKKTSGQRNLTLELCRDLPVPVPDEIEVPLSRIRVNRDCVRSARTRLDSARAAAAKAAAELLRGPNCGDAPQPGAIVEVYSA